MFATKCNISLLTAKIVLQWNLQWIKTNSERALLFLLPFINHAKVRSILLSYFIHMRLNVNGSFFVQKNDFEENKFKERFGECSLFTSKDPLTLSLLCIK